MMTYVISGLTIGAIIALASIALSLTYGILKFANLSQGDLLTTFAYIGFAFLAWLDNIYLAALGTILTAVLIGIILEKLVWRPLRKKGSSSVAMVISALGIAIFMRHILMAVAGPGIKFYDISGKVFRLGNVRINTIQIIIIGTAIAAMLAVTYLLEYTKLGKALRATSEEPDLAKVSGINIDQVIHWMWMISMSLTGLAGVLYGLQTSLRPDMGFYLLIPLFAAVFLGGIGNPFGAMIGGFLIGLIQDMSLIFLPSQYKIAVSFVIMIVILIFRPKGLLGGIG